MNKSMNQISIWGEGLGSMRMGIGSILISFGLLTGCATSQLVRDESIAISSVDISSAQEGIAENVRVGKIVEKMSIASVDICRHKMPQLDFTAFALPTSEKRLRSVEMQAYLRSTLFDDYPRVVASRNPAIKIGAKIESINGVSLGSDIDGTSFQRELASAAVGADAVEITIDGVRHRYEGPKVCAAATHVAVGSKKPVITVRSLSDRFIVFARTDKRYSERAVALDIALQMAAGAGGGLDAAAVGVIIRSVTDFIPYVALFSVPFASHVVKKAIDQKEIDMNAIKMLEASGVDPQEALADLFSACKCSHHWTEERKNNWKKQTALSQR